MAFLGILITVSYQKKKNLMDWVLKWQNLFKNFFLYLQEATTVVLSWKNGYSNTRKLMSLKNIASITFAVIDICTTVMLKMVNHACVYSVLPIISLTSLSIHNITKGHRGCSGLTYHCF